MFFVSKNKKSANHLTVWRPSWNSFTWDFAPCFFCLIFFKLKEVSVTCNVVLIKIYAILFLSSLAGSSRDFKPFWLVLMSREGVEQDYMFFVRSFVYSALFLHVCLGILFERYISVLVCWLGFFVKFEFFLLSLCLFK